MAKGNRDTLAKEGGGSTGIRQKYRLRKPIEFTEEITQWNVVQSRCFRIIESVERKKTAQKEMV